MKKFVCRHCKRPKVRKGFGTVKRTRNKVCKKCCAESVRRCYALTNYKDKHKRARRRRTIENHKRILDYLQQHPCVDCPETDPLVLQFDHENPDETSQDVTGLSHCSWARILLEIAKCLVRCANCHARRTAQQQNTVRWRLMNGTLKA